MAKENIGLIECGVCGFPDAAVRVSKNNLAYVMCEDCGAQNFCRSVACDEKLRARMRPAGTPLPARAAKPKPEPEPQPEPEPEPKPKRGVLSDDDYIQ